MRLFLALSVPEQIARRLERLSQSGRENAPGARWVRPGSMHVTLKFLGATEETRLPEIVRLLRAIGAPQPEIAVRGAGVFPRAGSFYAEVTPEQPLLHLATTIERAMAQCGFMAEARPFHPHITLARFRGAASARALEAIAREQARRDFGSFRPAEFLLYRSMPEPGGSRYDPLERFALRSAR